MISKTDTYLNDLAEIPTILERCSRFISLSGLAGVVTESLISQAR
ncbi:hypothetical protein [Cesiribacter sp. SM1]|nr:hypothetical protein [Cesiribacter sp. SM1]